jgi:acyl dehydratase
MTTSDVERPPVLAAGLSVIDPWLSVEYARVLGITNPLYTDDHAARAAGYRSVLVPETQLFLAARVGEAGEAPRDAVGLPDGYNAVVTGIRTEYVRPVEAGQTFTVRVRRLPSPVPPTARVKEFHLLQYELTDVDGEVATLLELTIAEFNE